MLSLITPPTVEPLAWDDVKVRLRLDNQNERAQIESLLIPSARKWVENYTKRRLITATYELAMRRWPSDGVIRLPLSPLQSVTDIKYMDMAGALQTLAASVYVVETPTEQTEEAGQITLAYGQVWPQALPQENSIKVTFVVGYGAAGSNVPQQLLDAMLKRIAESFENREEQIAGMSVRSAVTAEQLADDYRVLTL